jgi:hypothetical protein
MRVAAAILVSLATVRIAHAQYNVPSQVRGDSRERLVAGGFDQRRLVFGFNPRFGDRRR